MTNVIIYGTHNITHTQAIYIQKSYYGKWLPLVHIML